MADAANSREGVLNALRKAEIDGARREEKAREKAFQVREATQAECARIVEQAEKDGRAAMRQAVEAARAECTAIKDTEVSEAMRNSHAAESDAIARIPAVVDMIFQRFVREHNVKD